MTTDLQNYKKKEGIFKMFLTGRDIPIIKGIPDEPNPLRGGDGKPRA
jgi:hypothetical protein